MIVSPEQAMELSSFTRRLMSVIEADLGPLLKHAILLQCALGAQPGSLGEMSWERLERLFKNSSRIRRAHRSRLKRPLRRGRAAPSSLPVWYLLSASCRPS